MPKISLCASIGAIGANARFRDVQIDFHNPALAPDIFDQHRKPRFKALADIAAALPQKRVFRGLLADRGAAANTATLLIAPKSSRNGLAVKAIMQAKFAIFTRNRR